MQYKTLTTMFFLLGLTAAATAQTFGAVQETTQMMSLGSRPGFRIEFVNADLELVESMWIDFVKKNFGGKLKRDRKSKELIATGLKSPMVGIDAFTLYTQLEKRDKAVVLTAFFDKGASFLNRRDDPNGTQEISNALRQFYYDVRRSVVGSEVKTQETQMREMETRLKRLQKDNDSLRRDIEAYKAKIKKAEEDLVQNQKDQESTTVDLENQRQKVEQTRQRMNNVQNEQ